MDKLLKETETLYLSAEDEAHKLFQKIDEVTVWQRCYAKELIAVGIEDIPICMDIARNALGATLSEVSDESIRENMESLNIGLKVPFENGYHGHPLGDTAFPTLIQRAGYGSSSALMNLNDKNTQKVMSPEFKALVINKGLECFSNRVLVMIRDEKVRAVLSGDESDYSPLPFSELVVTFKTGLKQQFKEVFFGDASVDHSFSSAVYIIKDKDLSDNIKEAFDYACINTDGMVPAARLISSDVGISGANIYPYLKSATRQIMIGTPLTLTHKNGHNISDFANNVEKVVAMFKDASEKLKAMQQTGVKHPEGCLLRLAKQIGLSKKLSCEAAPNFAGVYGNSTTQIDVYWELQDIYEAMDKASDNKLSEARKIQLQENIARVCFGNMADYDLPFQWE